MKRFLVIRFSSLGDIILLTPLFRALKKRYPEAEVDFLTSNTFASVCLNNPHINRIIDFDRKADPLPEMDRVCRICRMDECDLIIDAHRSLRSRLLLWRCLGWRVPFEPRIRRMNKRSFKRNLLLLTGINLLEGNDSQRAEYLKLVPGFGIPAETDLKTELFPAESDRQRVAQLFEERDLQGKQWVALGPGASFPGKCWPKEQFLAVANRLLDSGYGVLLVGAAEEPEPVWISEQTRGRAVNLAGELSYLETAAVLETCRLVISNDSAVVHFGEAMGVPAIAIFGPTVKEFGFAPFLSQSRLIATDLSCRPCTRNGKGRCRNAIQRRCLLDIPAAVVIKDALQILARSDRNK